MKALASVATRATRAGIAFRRRHSALRKPMPRWLIEFLSDLQARTDGVRRHFMEVKEQSTSTNVYHLGLQKTGSMWLQSVLCDPVVYRYSGLLPHRVRGTRRASQMDPLVIAKPFPERRIISKLYISRENFLNIPKPEKYRAFFVVRDPRELLVSWYFSTRDNHFVKRDPARPLYKVREELRSMDQSQGMKHCIDVFEQLGKFELLRSWVTPDAELDGRVKIVRFEDLSGPDAAAHFAELFTFLDIRIPTDELMELVHAYSFKKLSGRQPGEENTKSHLRSGAAKTWDRYLTADLLDYFEERSRGLAGALGYPTSA
jgi:hypothetical protein